MRFVLDAPVTITWAMRDEDHPLADLAFNQLGSGSAIVPAIWWYELRNILVLNERRGRIAPEDSILFLHSLDQLKIEIAPLENGMEMMAISRKYRLSIYDAAYIELAQRNYLPLATHDKVLEAAARSAGIPLLA